MDKEAKRTRVWRKTMKNLFPQEQDKTEDIENAMTHSIDRDIADLEPFSGMSAYSVGNKYLNTEKTAWIRRRKK